MNRTTLSYLTSLIVSLVVLSLPLEAQQSSCISPTDFRQASTLVDHAGLAWKENGASTRWRIVWGALGMAPENMPNQLEVYTNQAIVPVSSGTSQMAYVQSLCGGRGSNWVGPVVITSSADCNPITKLNSITDTVCGHSSASLSTPNLQEAVWWYAGLPQNYGSSYTTEILQSNRTYWVTPTVKNSDPQIIAPHFDLQAGNFANFSNGQVIRVLDTLLLDSATLVSNGPTDYLIEVWNGNQTNLLQKSPSLHIDHSGVHRVNIGIALTPGLYILKVSVIPGGGSLFRSTEPQSYPYVLPGLMSIDSTTVGPINRFYYLYDLSVRTLCIGPSSYAHVRVGRQGEAGPDVTDTLCIQDSVLELDDLIADAQVSADGYWQEAHSGDSLQWIDLSKFNPGDKQKLYYISPGTHNCADTACYVLTMLNCELGIGEASETSSLELYPNPASDYFSLHLDESMDLNHLSVTTLRGQKVKEFYIRENNRYYIGDLPVGLYIVHGTSSGFHYVAQLQVH